MTFRNLQTAVDYATLTAAVAGLPDPLDRDYVLEDQDQATYTEDIINVAIDTAGFRLTIRGRPGLPPTFNPPPGGGGKGTTYAGVLSFSTDSRHVTLSDLNITDGWIELSNIDAPGVYEHRIDRCSIRTTGPDALNLNGLGPGPGGGVPAALVTNCALLSATGPAAFNTGNQFVAYRNCTFSSFDAPAPNGGEAAILWLPAAGAPQLELRSCLIRYSSPGQANHGVVWTNALGLGSIDADGNLFHLAGAANYAWNETDGAPVADLAAWRAVTGGDANSAEVVGAFPDAAMYADEAARDFALVPGAAAADAVLPAYEGLVVVDLLNRPRPFGAASDIGAFEAQAAAAPILDVLVVSERRAAPDGSVWVAASGAVGRRDGVAAVERTGPGVYVLAFEGARGRSFDEYHFDVSPLAPAPRTTTLEIVGASLVVRTFDAAGAPADANFSLALRRV